MADWSEMTEAQLRAALSRAGAPGAHARNLVDDWVRGGYADRAHAGDEITRLLAHGGDR